MYDSEARGARLLERLRLTADQQRLVLIGAGQSLKFEDVKEAAQLQFPEHRQVPPVMFTREFDGGRQQPEKPEAKGQPKGTGKPKGKSSFKHERKGKGAHTFVTEQVDDPPEDVPEGLEGIPEDPEGGRRRSGGRRRGGRGRASPGWRRRHRRGGPGPGHHGRGRGFDCDRQTPSGRTPWPEVLGRQDQLEERKRKSHCSACGQLGHWAGDEACSVSAHGKPKATAKAPGKGLPERWPSVRFQGDDRAV